MALNNVPLPGQTLAQTRDPIRNNFSVIDTAFSVNHVSYNDSDQGKHKFITFPNQLANPALPAANEINIFAKDLAGTPQLYLQRTAGTPLPFTAATLAGALGATGFTSLPSGILLKWGRQGAAPNGVAAVVFDATVPFTQVYTVYVSPLDYAMTLPPNTATFSVASGSITNLGCTLIYSGSGPNPIQIQYLAIGRGT